MYWCFRYTEDTFHCTSVALCTGANVACRSQCNVLMLHCTCKCCILHFLNSFKQCAIVVLVHRKAVHTYMNPCGQSPQWPMAAGIVTRERSVWWSDTMANECASEHVNVEPEKGRDGQGTSLYLLTTLVVNFQTVNGIWAWTRYCLRCTFCQKRIKILRNTYLHSL